MAVKTPKVSQWLGVPYPDEECDPFYDQFEAMIQAFEAVTFYDKLSRNAVFGGGGTRSWNPSTGLFQWTDDFSLLVPHWGFRILLRYGPDGTTRAANIAAGQMLWARLPMGMNDNVITNFVHGSQLTKERHDELVCIARVGDALHMRTIGEVA